jgi:hypothetical protein
MPIPTQQARGIFTQQLIARWNELRELAPKSFLRSFFTQTTTDSKYVSIEVMRGTEKIAVDVLRGTEGNRNTFSKSAEKIFMPPFFNENLDMTEFDKYDVMFGQDASSVTPSTIESLIGQALDKLVVLRYKIERAYELQASQVFTSGIVTVNAGDNIDYKRKAASMVVNTAGEYWKVATVDPRIQLKAAANFLRTIGKAGDGLFNVILGQNALTDFLANPFITNDLIKDIKLIDLQMPQTSAQGAVYHGRISAGPYVFDLWSYPEYYDNSVGVSTPYINDDYIAVLPSGSAKFNFAFGGIPAIVRDTRNAEFPELITSVPGDYVIGNYIDVQKKKHVFEIMSAGLAVPVSIDRIYSAKVTGTDVTGG